MARRSARALLILEARGFRTRDILTSASVHNAMVTHAAFGGSTNLILHIPAIAHAAGLPRPVAADWTRINRQVPRLVDALPNGPRHHPTVQVFLAGGVPEVMLHLRRAGLLETRAMTASGLTLGDQLDQWEASERRASLRRLLRDREGVDPDCVILSPDEARRSGLASTVCFAAGNLAPEGSVVKSTAIDPSVIDADGVYRKVGPAKVFLTEREAIAAIKDKRIQPGDVMVLACRGPLGAGMEECFQLTSALRYTAFGKDIALLTDARFSGVSTGACIGHVSPEALAGGPIGKLREGDIIEIVIDSRSLDGSVNFVGEGDRRFSAEEGARILGSRSSRPDLASDPALPDDTRLWAALQDASGLTWGGCFYDVDESLTVLAAGKRALGENKMRGS
jgi:putative YjhG/YagF family dehydratase